MDNRKNTQLDPKKFKLMTKIGSFIQKKEPGFARREMWKLIDLDPLDPSSRTYVSQCLAMIGDIEQALFQAFMVIVLDEQCYIHGFHYLRVAVLLHKKGDFKEAERVLELGWQILRGHYSRQDQEVERRKYFEYFEKLIE